MRQRSHIFAAPVAKYKSKAPDHGSHIYAYRHVYTNQVLYSLTQTLDGVRSLRQLPDLGANTAQATGRIRRDMWRPFFSVYFPSETNGTLQGQNAYRKLHYWRKLHEHYWTPPASLSQPYTEEQKEELQDRLDRRGGSKKETVYDLITREKKKIRRAEVMDQKANSVADLAAVLLEQEEQTAEKTKLLQEEHDKEMISLHVASRTGGLEEIEKEIGQLRLDIEKEDTERWRAGVMGRTIARLERKKARMSYAPLVVGEALQRFVPTAFATDPAAQDNPSQDDPSDLQQVTADDTAAENRDQLRDVLIGVHLARKELASGTSVSKLRAMMEEPEFLSPPPDPLFDRPATDAELQALQDMVNGYQVASEPKAIFSIMKGNFRRNTPKNIYKVLGSIDSQLQDGSVTRTTAETELLQHNRDIIQRLLPAYEQAREKRRRPYGSKAVRRTLVNARRRIKEARDRGPNAEALRRRKNHIQGYERTLQVLERDAQRAVAEADPPAKSEQPAAEGESSAGAEQDVPSEEDPLAEPELPARHVTVDLGKYVTGLPDFPASAGGPALQQDNFTMEGVRVKWHNVLDAEFAEEWPADVAHEPMGLVKFTAPSARTSNEPALEVSQQRLQAFDKRREAVKRRTESNEKVQQQILESMKENPKLRPYFPAPDASRGELKEAAL